MWRFVTRVTSKEMLYCLSCDKQLVTRLKAFETVTEDEIHKMFTLLTDKSSRMLHNIFVSAI